MPRIFLASLTSVFLLWFLLPWAKAWASSELLFEKAVFAEETSGDLDAAILLYQQITDDEREAEGRRAEAQYRVGVCYLKQGNEQKALPAFRRLVDKFPQQEQWVSRAKEHLPGWLELRPAPWVDGEHLHFAVRLPGGMPVGMLSTYVEPRTVDGTDFWWISLRRYFEAGVTQNGVSEVIAERGNLRPIRGHFKMSPGVNFATKYEPGRYRVEGEADGRPLEYTVDAPVVYDNDSVIHLFRRLPLTEDFKATLPINTWQPFAPMDVDIQVLGKEVMTVPAGEFECFRIHSPTIMQTVWVATEAPYYPVQMEFGGVVAELSKISVKDLRQPEHRRFDDAGLELTMPAGWSTSLMKTPGEDPASLFLLLDPAAELRGFLRVEDVDEKVTLEMAVAQHAKSSAALMKDFRVREESRRNQSVGGLPAHTFTADFKDQGQAMVEMATVVANEDRVAAFTFLLDAEILKSRLPELEALTQSLRLD